MEQKCPQEHMKLMPGWIYIQGMIASSRQKNQPYLTQVFMLNFHLTLNLLILWKTLTGEIMASDQVGNEVNKVTYKEALEQLRYEIEEEGHCSFIEDEMKVAFDALEKQIPKKPLFFDSVPHARCPVCKCSVKLFADAHESHFCLYCGQKLDWGHSE